MFLQYQNHETSDCKILTEDVESSPEIISLFNLASSQLDEMNLFPNRDKLKVNFKIKASVENHMFRNIKVMFSELSGSACIESRNVNCKRVSAYGQPADKNLKRTTIIQDFSLGETSIFHQGQRIYTCLDLTNTEAPPLHQFRFFEVAGQDEFNFEELEIIEPQKIYQMTGKIDVTLDVAENNL